MIDDWFLLEQTAAGLGDKPTLESVMRLFADVIPHRGGELTGIWRQTAVISCQQDAPWRRLPVEDITITFNPRENRGTARSGSGQYWLIPIRLDGLPNYLVRIHDTPAASGGNAKQGFACFNVHGEEHDVLVAAFCYEPDGHRTIMAFKKFNPPTSEL
jgi:hypothetical protein